MSRRRTVKSPSLDEKKVPLIWHYAMIVLAGFIVYMPSFRGVFLLDDGVYITASPNVKSLQPIWNHLADPDRGLVRLSLAVNYALGGLDPTGYHIFNLAVHLLSALTLFGLARRTLFRDANLRNRADGIAFAIALVWVIHPLATQAVTYIIQRGESMMALCYLLTLYGLARGAATVRAWPWSIAAIASCAAGMRCKEVMITAPLVALIYDRMFLVGSWRELARKRWGVYVALAATTLLLAGSNGISGLLGKESASASMGFRFPGATPWEYFRSQPAILLHYLRLVVWPYPLCFDHDRPVAAMSAGTMAAGLAMVVLLIATAVAMYRKRAVGFLGAAFFLILAPTSSFVPIKDLAVEHRMYLPLAAIIAILVLAADRLLWRTTKATQRTILCTVASILGVLTFWRNGVYADAIAMWSNVVAQRPDNARAWSHLGNAQSDAGQFDVAIASYRESLRCKPDWAEIENNLGEALAKANRLEESAAAFKSALMHGPNLTHVHLNLALVLQQLGHPDEAIEHYQIGLAASPGQVGPWNNLGIALRDLGRLAEAEAAHRTALRLAPTNAAAHYALAYVLEKEGRTSEAVQEYRATLRIDPGNSGARTRLQSLETRTGHP